jgi:leucyl-tRNA synthetase
LSTKVPTELKSKVWHSTSIENATSIVRQGFILAEPDIDQAKFWGGKSERVYPFVRSIGGISLFDFRLPSSHVSKILYNFIPCKSGCTQTVWFGIDVSRLGDLFLSADETRIRWMESGMNRQYMPKLESTSLCPIPISCINSIYISRKNGVFKPTTLEIFA